MSAHFTKKILIVSNNPFYGGGEVFILETISKLKNFNIYYLVKNDELYDALPKGRKNKFYKNTFWGQIKEMNGIIQMLSVSVVIFNGGSTLFFTLFVPSVKKILYRHTTNKSISIFKRWLYIPLLHFCYMVADKIIHVSQYSLSEQKLAKQKATYIHHGIYVLPYKSHEAKLPLNVLFVGRIDCSKGIDKIIKAFYFINKNLATLHIVGKGKQDDFIKMNTKTNVIHHGFQKNLATYYESCDVFITLPIVESFGLTVIEAMNHSKPIITTNVGAISEIVDKKNAFLVKRTVKDVKKVLQLIIDRPSQLNAMGIQSHNIVKQKFNKEDTISKISNILNSVLQ